MSYETKNEGRIYVVEVLFFNHNATLDSKNKDEECCFWYDLVDEKTIQWTLLLAKAHRDKKAIEIDAETNEIKGLRERLE